MRILYLSRYGESTVYATVEDFLTDLENEDISLASYNASERHQPKAYYIPDELQEVKVQEFPARFVIVADGDSTEIPAPMPGETVTDYAARLVAATT